MALVQCPECGREISDQATVCPQCGYPVKPLKQERKTEYSFRVGATNGSGLADFFSVMAYIFWILGGILTVLELFSGESFVLILLYAAGTFGIGMLYYAVGDLRQHRVINT